MAEMGMHSVRYMRGYIRVAFWQRWACCPLFARVSLGVFSYRWVGCTLQHYIMYRSIILNPLFSLSDSG